MEIKFIFRKILDESDSLSTRFTRLYKLCLEITFLLAGCIYSNQMCEFEDFLSLMLELKGIRHIPRIHPDASRENFILRFLWMILPVYKFSITIHQCGLAHLQAK